MLHFKREVLLLASVLFFSACFVPASMVKTDKLEKHLIAELQEVLDSLQHEKAEKTNSARAQQDSSQVTIFESGFKVEGTYAAENGLGLFFLVEDADHGMGTVLITDLSTDVIFYFRRVHDDPMIITVRDTSLLYIQATQSLYKVAPSKFLAAEKAVTDNQYMDIVVSQLERITNAEGLTYLASLTNFSAAVLSTFSALVREYESAAASPSMQVFTGFAQTMSAKASVAVQFEHTQSKNQFWAQSSQATETCSSYPTTCPVGECPGAGDCSGICGPGGCDCWPLWCGDCCVHTSCLGLDGCCKRTDDFYAQVRCWVPLGFHCDNDFTC